ncbi:MAG TPA: thioredoxin domain-containing protein, partial [Candidatus Methanofastidiosum sp.]|nr:thioredoxin domain-containing protein [Methanofastidiosum sp.]
PIVKEILKIKGDTLKFIFRNFPLYQIHFNALHSAYAAESAGKQNKFWEMHDKLLQNQENLEDKDLQQYAKDLSLDINQFTKDMKSDEITKKVEEDINGGIESGVNATPTFFVNGISFDKSTELDLLLEAIDLVNKE